MLLPLNKGTNTKKHIRPLHYTTEQVCLSSNASDFYCKAPGSNLGGTPVFQTDLSWVSSVPPGKCRDNTIN